MVIGSLVLTACSFSGNFAQIGGAIFIGETFTWSDDPVTAKPPWADTWVCSVRGCALLHESQCQACSDTRSAVITDSSFVSNSVYVDTAATTCGFAPSGGEGGAIYVNDGSADVTGSSFVDNKFYGAGLADELGDGSSWVLRHRVGSGRHMVALGSDTKVYDTRFEPYEATTEFVNLNSLNGCEQYPCAAGQSCSYESHSLLCTPCPANTISADGLTCSACPAGYARKSISSLCIFFC